MNVKDLSPQEIWKEGITERFKGTGFQATELAKAIEIIAEAKREKSYLFLGFTANLMATGLRGLIVELCKKKFT